VATTWPTRTTDAARLRAPGEGEAERLRLPAVRATTAAARVVVVPSPREVDGVDAVEKGGRTLRRGTPNVLVLSGVHVPSRRPRMGRGP
jgi:hypothetical protein